MSAFHLIQLTKTIISLWYIYSKWKSECWLTTSLRRMWIKKFTRVEGEKGWTVLKLQIMFSRGLCVKTHPSSIWSPSLEKLKITRDPVESNMGTPSFSQKETASPITEKTEPTILSTKSFYFVSIQHFNFWKIFHTNYLQGLYTLAPQRKGLAGWLGWKLA